VGIYLNGSRSSEATGGDFATLKEVRAALERFRAAGKTILAYNMNWSDYYLSSVANTIVLNLGEMEIDGLSAQPLFLTGALESTALAFR